MYEKLPGVRHTPPCCWALYSSILMSHRPLCLHSALVAHCLRPILQFIPLGICAEVNLKWLSLEPVKGKFVFFIGVSTGIAIAHALSDLGS